MNEIPDQPWLRGALRDIAGASDRVSDTVQARAAVRGNVARRARRRVQRVTALCAATAVGFGVVVVNLQDDNRGSRPVEIVNSTEPGNATFTSKSSVNSGAFQPVSASFVTPQVGWVLGVDGACDAGECPAVVQRTADGGRTWQRVNAPAQSFSPHGDPDSGGASTVRFSSAASGYLAIFGKLWSTVDAGSSWTPIAYAGSGRPDAAIWALALTADKVVVVTRSQGSVTFTLSSATIGASEWEVVGELPVASPAPYVLIATAGSAAWVALNDRGARPDGFRLRSGRWETWSPPCAKRSLSASFTAVSESRLVAACASTAVTQTDAMLLESTDGGSSFSSTTVQPGATDVVVLDAFDDGAVFLRTERGIIRSTPGASGREWSDSLLAQQVGLIDVGTVGDATAYVVTSVGRMWRMLITDDAGRHWRDARFDTDEAVSTTSTDPTTIASTTTTTTVPRISLPAAIDFPDLLVADAKGLWDVSVKEKRLLLEVAKVQSAFRLRDGSVVFETQAPFTDAATPREIWRWNSGAPPRKLEGLNPATLLGVGVANGHDAILLLRENHAESEQVTLYDTVTERSTKLGHGFGGDSGPSRASIGDGVLVESMYFDLADGVAYTNLDGTETQGWTALTDNLPFYPSYERTEIVVSPDGSRLAYLDGPPELPGAFGPDPKVAWQLVVVDRTGKEYYRATLTNYMDYDGHLQLDFDGRWAVVSYSNGAPIVADTRSAQPVARELVGLSGSASLAP